MTEISARQLEIIEAAGKILTASGVGGLTIKNLAKEMKFSESAIYRHFKSKDDIIVAMLEYLAEMMEDRLIRAIQTSDGPKNKFRALFQSQFKFFSEQPYFVVAVFSDGLMKESGRINDAIFKIMAIKMRCLMPLIMEGQQKGIYTNAITGEELLHIVMGSFRLQMFKWRIAKFQFDIVRSGDNLIHSLLTLISRQ